MTTTSRAVERLISYSWTDWWVSMDEQKAAMAALRTDPDLASTIRDLHASGMLYAAVNRLPPYELVQLFGGACDAGMKGIVRSAILRSEATASGGGLPVITMNGQHDVPWLFDLSFDIQNSFRRMGARFRAMPFNRTDFSALIPSAPDAPFSGSGATGVSPTTLRIPIVDQALLLTNYAETVRYYSNPLPIAIFVYLRRLTSAVRTEQARLLSTQPISSIVPHSYGSRLPSRAAVIELAAAQYALEPALLTAFLLAEARHQSRNEDAKDLTAALSVARVNTSIGLGQIKISTARNGDLFSDLLSSPVRSSLGHERIALLLTSEELNIFGVAKYTRAVANRGAAQARSSLANVHKTFPGLNLASYTGHSAGWPEDNKRVLGMFYTSTEWVNKIESSGWGEFVFEAYRDVRASGVYAP